MRPWVVLIAVLLLLVTLAACAGSSGQRADSGAGAALAPATGSAGAGEGLFAQQILRTEKGSNAGCITCHSLQPGQALVGPSMAGIASRAGSTVAGESAASYLKNSILAPNAHLASGCNMRDPAQECIAGLMPQNYGEILSEEEIDSLVAYMLTLE